MQLVSRYIKLNITVRMAYGVWGMGHVPNHARIPPIDPNLKSEIVEVNYRLKQLSQVQHLNSAAS
jgi:hypothetical protein